jgi:hypothetical protein
MVGRERQALISSQKFGDENQLKISHVVDFLHKNAVKGSNYSQTKFFAKKMFDAFRAEL